MKITPPKAVLFDWDNTLVNTWPIIHAALHDTFAHMGQTPWTLEETKSRVAKSMRDAFPGIFGDRWEEASEVYQERYRSRHLKHLEAFPEAENVLKHIKNKGWYLAIVSNKKGPNLRRELAHLGWDHYFTRAVGADDAARDKPFADPVLMALQGSGIAPGLDVWFVGDSDVDLECAEATGCLPVLYGPLVLPDGEVANGKYKGFAYTHHVEGHPNLMQLLAATG